MNRNNLGILGLRIGLFGALVTKETSTETYKNRNSLDLFLISFRQHYLVYQENTKAAAPPGPYPRSAWQEYEKLVL